MIGKDQHGIEYFLEIACQDCRWHVELCPKKLSGENASRELRNDLAEGHDGGCRQIDALLLV